MPEVIFNGPAGRIEARYHHGKSDGAPVALCLHPHPEHGGTMNNKIVFHLYKCFQDRGFSVMRFNFRGVGRSQGAFDRGEGELSDAAAALDWLQTYNPNARSVWIAGFSFGAWIGMQLLMRRPEIDSFVAIAPPANMYDFSFLAPCPSSGLFVQGGSDDIVDPDAVRKLVEKLRSQRGIAISYDEIRGANHFFHGHMDAMAGKVDNYIGAFLKAEKKQLAAAAGE